MLTPAMFEQIAEESQIRSVIQRIEKELTELNLEAKNLDSLAHAPIPRQACRARIKNMRNKIDVIQAELEKAEQQVTD